MRQYLLIMCILMMGTLFPNTLFAQEVVISPNDAKKMKDVEIAGIRLGMTLEDIAVSMREREYRSVCGVIGCQFSKFGGVANVSINFKKNALKKDRPELIQYSTKNATRVCQEALKTMCPMGTDNFPCRTKEQFTIMRAKSVEASDDGWKYAMNIMVDSIKRKCEIRASQTK